MDLSMALKAKARIAALEDFVGKARLHPSEEWKREAAGREAEALREQFRRDLMMLEMRFSGDRQSEAFYRDRGVYDTGTVELLRGNAVRKDTGPMEVVAGRGEIRGPAIVILSGNVGVGKSVALAFAATRGDQGLMVDSSTIASTPRNGWSDNERAWQEWLNISPLCIDELGIEGDVENARVLLLLRWNRGLVTIGSSNLTQADFVGRYFASDAARFADRLRTQKSWFHFFTGSSMRSAVNGK